MTRRFLRKIAVVEEGIQMHELYQADAFDVMCAVGGLDIAGLSGVFTAVPWHMYRWSLTESSVRWLRLRRSG